MDKVWGVIILSFGPELFSALSADLNSRLLPAPVGKIETGEFWAALQLFRKGDWLLFSWNPQHYGCGLVGDEEVSWLKKMRTARSSFGEALKSHLSGASLKESCQEGEDRILRIRAERFLGAGFPVAFSLLFEGMERNSNLLFLDGEDIILAAAKSVYPDSNRYRTIIPGRPYAPPPPLQGPSWKDIVFLTGPSDLKRVPGIGRGLALAVEEEWENLPPDRWKKGLDGIFALPELQSSLVLQKRGKYLTVFPELLPGAKALSGPLARTVGTEIMSSILSEERKRVYSGAKKLLEREIRRRERHRDGLANQLDMAEKSGEYRKKGQMLLASLESILPRVEKIVLHDWEEDRDVEIALDGKLSPAQNAERYFRKYKKGKVDVSAVRRGILSLEEGIEELREQLDSLESLDDPELLAAAVKDIFDWLQPKNAPLHRQGKKKEAIPPCIRLENGSDVLYIGLNARGNRHVTFKVASPLDLWFHVHELPGAHVILKRSGGPGTEEDNSVEIAASLAAWFSKGKNETKVQVDYTEKKNVRSIPGSAVAKVTYTSPRTLSVTPDRWKEFPGVAQSRTLADKR